MWLTFVNRFIESILGKDKSYLGEITGLQTGYEQI